jgi:hypothetical protein
MHIPLVPISESLSVHTSVNICFCPSANNEPFYVSHLASPIPPIAYTLYTRSDLCGDRGRLSLIFQCLVNVAPLIAIDYHSL